MMTRRCTIRRWALAAIVAAVCVGPAAIAEPPISAEDLPRELEGVGVTERLNEEIPLDLAFKDETGRDVTLREYFKPGKPVILTLNFHKCSFLCNETLKGLINSLLDIDWSAGQQFDIITVSFNPNEGPELAEVKKRAFLLQYTRESAKDGWHFLTGNQQSIDALCKATGFGYRQVGEDDFAHTSTIMFLTPDGRLSRYMNDVLFQPRDVRLALIEASEGAIGSPMDKFLLFMCYHYDPAKGTYIASARKIMTGGGVVTVVLLAVGLSWLWWRYSGTPGIVRGARAAGAVG